MRTYLLAFASLLTTQVVFAQSGDFAITGAKVIVGDGQVLDGATVIIKGGKIESVSTAAAPSGLTVVDGKGKFLYPGFIDSYSTRLTKSAPDPKSEGKPDLNLSAPPYMWIGNRKGIFSDFGAADNLDFEKDSSSYENGITTVLLAPNKGCVRGSCAVVNLLPSSDKARVLNSLYGFGLGFRNAGGEGYPSNILGVLALMRQVLSDAKSLSDGVVLTTEKTKPYWLKSLEDLKPLVTGTRPGIFEANIDREIERSLRFGTEFNFPVMIAGGRDAYKMTDQLAGSKVSVLYSVDSLIEPSVEPDKATVEVADQTPVEYKKERHDKWEEQMKGIGILSKSGVKFALSSGASPGSFLENVRGLIKFGLDKDAALKAMTSNAAEILGMRDQLGTIEMGKQANLVLMSGDFADKTSKVEKVWITGKAVLEPAKEVKK
jgi:ABC-type amino acid transport substrate-binding protein